jgi:hypothetical protein
LNFCVDLSVHFLLNSSLHSFLCGGTIAPLSGGFYAGFPLRRRAQFLEYSTIGKK